MSSHDISLVIALLGLGSIGVSFASLYLKHTKAKICVYDPRTDLDEHVRSVLPGYLHSQDQDLSVESLIASKRLRLCSSVEEACRDADIVQEQGPENLPFKAALWKQVLGFVSPDTHLWSSTSGITASRQIAELNDKHRLLVVHPFNPPHLMRLIELVPSPMTHPAEVSYAQSFFNALGTGHQPVVVQKEVAGFVGNRLAFALLREACHLVSEGVVSVDDLDTIVEASIGPRWAVTGPFKSYHYGGGIKGLGAFFQNLAGTIDTIWDDAGKETFKGTSFLPDASTGAETTRNRWADDIVKQTTQLYGMPSTTDFDERDRALQTLFRMRDEPSH